ncbi:MAG TPA: tetratricopeptide repeat protein [Candidatus Limnocylindrales bacterium]|nr:tetratricopeptide repeat protein [Candidatus Limnocylindrales bacterium]
MRLVSLCFMLASTVYGQTTAQLLKDAWTALQAKNYTATRDASLAAIKLDPKNQTAWFYLGRAYDLLGQTGGAEEAYKTLIAINPRHQAAYNNLGVTYMRQKRADEAIAAYRKQVEVSPHEKFAPFNLARALESRGDWAEARQFAAKAAELSPEEPARWLFLGKMQLKTGQTEDAQRSFDRVLALPHDAMTENNIAYALADAGLQIERSSQLIQKALASQMSLVCEAQNLGDGDKCTTELRHLAFMLDSAGWIQYRQGNLEAAQKYLQSAFAITPRAEAQLHLATVLAKNGQLDRAVKEYVQVRDREDFDRVDSEETVRELAAAAGGQAQLDALLERAPVGLSTRARDAKAIALVDQNGKVLDVRAVVPASSDLAAAAKATTLPPLAWPVHGMQSIRTIEFQRVGEQWVASESYAGETAPPPPCAVAPKPPVTLLTQNGQGSVRSCAGL